MEIEFSLEPVAHIASIVTACVAVGAWARFSWAAWSRKVKLEYYLKNEKSLAKGDDKGRRSLLHLMTRLGLTESEILQASYRSHYVRRTLDQSNGSTASTSILLEYDKMGCSY